jgi:CubicO group peptidase (beta-lactamase class C family)
VEEFAMTARLRQLITLSLLIALSAVPIFADDHLGLPQAKPESVGMSSEKLEAIEKNLGAFVENGQLPGIVAVVAREGKVVYFEAFGKRDVERDLPMEKDTIFRMYSMTKPVTGAAIMTLVDDGKIKVSDPVSKYLPEFSEMTVLVENEDGTTKTVPAETPLTIHHLLTHTGGLIYGLFDTGALGKMYADNDINSDGASGVTLEAFSKAVAKMPLKAQPGTEWHYGVSMDVLGRIVEVVTGQRYADFLAERIFEPLDMKDSEFHVPAEKADRFASNYEPEDGGMALLEDSKTSPFLNVPSQDSGGGGMVGTAADYLRFAQMLLNGGELDGVRVLSEEAVEEMTTNQLGPEFGQAPLGTLMAGIPFNGIGFGYTGAVVMDGIKQTIFGGEGEYSWGGYASTDFWIDKKEKIVGLVLTQLIPTGTYPTRIVMHNATYAAITESYADEKPGD